VAPSSKYLSLKSREIDPTEIVARFPQPNTVLPRRYRRERKVESPYWPPYQRGGWAAAGVVPLSSMVPAVLSRTVNYSASTISPRVACTVLMFHLITDPAHTPPR
jgi:hypothetical protein